MTPSDRDKLERVAGANLDGLRLTPVPRTAPEMESDLPHVTHEGVLDIMGFKMRVYQLSDGRRVFPAEDIERFFGLAQGDNPQEDDRCGSSTR